MNGLDFNTDGIFEMLTARGLYYDKRRKVYSPVVQIRTYEKVRIGNFTNPLDARIAMIIAANNKDRYRKPRFKKFIKDAVMQVKEYYNL